MEHLNRAGRWATLLAFVAIAYLAVQPSNVTLVDDFNDKSKHILAFFVLTVGLLRYWRLSWASTALALLAFGVGIEVVQSFIPGRTATPWDLVANCIGFALGWASFQFLARADRFKPVPPGSR